MFVKFSCRSTTTRAISSRVAFSAKACARVHQATGIVVAQLAIAPDDALALLRAHAFAENATLDEIARVVVDRQLNFTNTQQGVTHDGTAPDDSTGSGGR